jgi:hypothetical protein
MPWCGRGGDAGWPSIVRAARGSPFIAKGMKLAKQESLIRAFGHERGRNKAHLWRRPRIDQTCCFVTFPSFATFVVKRTAASNPDRP